MNDVNPAWLNRALCRSQVVISDPCYLHHAPCSIILHLLNPGDLSSMLREIVCHIRLQGVGAVRGGRDGAGRL